MKHFLILLMATGIAITYCGTPNEAAAQNAEATSNPAEAPTSSAQKSNIPGIDSGTTLVVELTQSLDARKAKAGELVAAKVIQDVISHAKIAIPRYSRLIGHVTEVKALGHGSSASILGLVFDKVRLKDESEISFQAVIQAVASIPRDPRLDQPDPMVAADGSRTVLDSSGKVASSPQKAATTVGSSSNAYAYGLDASVSLGPGDISGPLLDPRSRGVIGLRGLRLEPDAMGAVQLIRSSQGNVHLEKGTPMVLYVKVLFHKNDP